MRCLRRDRTSWPKFLLFEFEPKGPGSSGLDARPLRKGFEYKEDEYVRERAQRDFFYLARRETPTAARADCSRRDAAGPQRFGRGRPDGARPCASPVPTARRRRRVRSRGPCGSRRTPIRTRRTSPPRRTSPGEPRRPSRGSACSEAGIDLFDAGIDLFEVGIDLFDAGSDVFGVGIDLVDVGIEVAEAGIGPPGGGERGGGVD